MHKKQLALKLLVDQIFFWPIVHVYRCMCVALYCGSGDVQRRRPRARLLHTRTHTHTQLHTSTHTDEHTYPHNPRSMNSPSTGRVANTHTHTDIHTLRYRPHTLGRSYALIHTTHITQTHAIQAVRTALIVNKIFQHRPGTGSEKQTFAGAGTGAETTGISRYPVPVPVFR